MSEIKRDMTEVTNESAVTPEAESESRINELTAELGHAPSDFESKLLAHPGDKDGQKKLAAELMLNDTGFTVGNLELIKKPEAQNRMNELAVEYKEAAQLKDTTERMKAKKRIAAEAKSILTEAEDEAE